MSVLYYNPFAQLSTSNVCGYGNHLACDMGKEGCECPCNHPQDTPSEEPKEPEEEGSYKF